MQIPELSTKELRKDVVTTTKVRGYVPINVAQWNYLLGLARNQDRDGSIIEIGSGSGFSSLALALGVKKKGSNEKIYSIDVLSLEERIETIMSLHKKYGVEGTVEFICAKSQDVLHNSYGFELPIRIILIDGSHVYEDVVSDIDNALRLADNHTKIVLHDYIEIHDGVCEAVNEAIKEERLRVTDRIDCMLVTKKVS